MRRRPQSGPFYSCPVFTVTLEEYGDADVSDPVRSWDAGLQARLDALVKRADGGDRAVLPAVKQIFDAVPGVWDAYGDLATIAESTLIDLLAGASALTREALRKRLAAMRAELAGSEAGFKSGGRSRPVQEQSSARQMSSDGVVRTVKRVADRERDWHEETVLNSDGSVHHQQAHGLSEHRGHGSDKPSREGSG